MQVYVNLLQASTFVSLQKLPQFTSLKSQLNVDYCITVYMWYICGIYIYI